MSNQEQLKVGDRVMLLPKYKNTEFSPFTICKVISIGFFVSCISVNDKELFIYNNELQPLPIKFDGWEEE